MQLADILPRHRMEEEEEEKKEARESHDEGSVQPMFESGSLSMNMNYQKKSILFSHLAVNKELLNEILFEKYEVKDSKQKILEMSQSERSHAHSKLRVRSILSSHNSSA